MKLGKEVVIDNIILGKLVHGGQAIAKAPDGRKLFIWGGLPGELVNIRVTNKKRSYIEGIVTEVLESSPDRIEPREPDSYLSTSPWQIIKFESENKAKEDILKESFEREGIKDISFEPFIYGKNEYGYRNKQEFGFWGNKDGINIAHFVRGSQSRQIVQGSALALEPINIAARAIRDELNRIDVWGGKLKNLILRCSNEKDVVGALFIKEKLDLVELQLPKELKGLDIYYSDPKSPASVPTEKLYSLGDIKLMDRVMGVNITYDVLSFFQVNLPVFEKALTKINTLTEGNSKIDMYSGVGTIGVSIDGTEVLIEPDATNVAMAKENIGNKSIKVIQATSEMALDYIDAKHTIIVDPPRSGLHKRVVERILEVKPPQVVYLSCNPSTQARDIATLQSEYSIVYAQGFNFFPRTPHIESLIMLELKS